MSLFLLVFFNQNCDRLQTWIESPNRNFFDLEQIFLIFPIESQGDLGKSWTPTPQPPCRITLGLTLYLLNDQPSLM